MEKFIKSSQAKYPKMRNWKWWDWKEW